VYHRSPVASKKSRSALLKVLRKPISSLWKAILFYFKGYIRAHIASWYRKLYHTFQQLNHYIFKKET
jgi:hypothetical protein